MMCNATIFYIEKVNDKWHFWTGQLDFILKAFSSHFDSLLSQEELLCLPRDSLGEP